MRSEKLQRWMQEFILSPHQGVCRVRQTDLTDPDATSEGPAVSGLSSHPAN